MLTMSLQMQGRTCVCVGGGAVAERRLDYLIREKASILVISPKITKQIELWQKQGALRWLAKDYDKTLLPKAQFVFALTDNKELNAQCANDARELGALVNRADEQADCDFTLPAEVTLGELRFTVSTGKCSPRLNRLLKMDMSQRYAPVVDSVQGIKRFRQEIRNLLPTSKEREEFWQTNLTSNDLETILNGGWSQVEEKIKNAISSTRR